jgi:hypothetical protein
VCYQNVKTANICLRETYCLNDELLKKRVKWELQH